MTQASLRKILLGERAPDKRIVYENVVLSLFIDTLLPRPHSKRESYIHIICIFYCPSKLVILSSIWSFPIKINIQDSHQLLNHHFVWITSFWYSYELESNIHFCIQDSCVLFYFILHVSLKLIFRENKRIQSFVWGKEEMTNCII